MEKAISKIKRFFTHKPSLIVTPLELNIDSTKEDWRESDPEDKPSPIMTPVKLNIDSIKEDWRESHSEDMPSLIMTPLKLNIDCIKKDWRESHPEHKSVPKGFDSSQWNAFQVIQEFLQPKSKLLLVDAVNRIIQAFPESYWIPTWLNEIFLEVAQQIPYNHQSQRKLADLVCLFGRGIGVRPSERIDEKKDFESLVDGYRSETRDFLLDCPVDPHNEEGELRRYVNFQAFLANLDANGLWYDSPVDFYTEIRDALEIDHEEASLAEEEAYIMGPAQWMLWNGQGLVRYMMWRPHDDEPEMTQSQWHLWRGKFKQAAADQKFGKECREVAAKAADVMEVLERAMLL